jgi:endonuclease-3 related protein
MTEILEEIYRRLHAFFGPQHWWPADTPFEVCVGAILTQNTSWKNVRKAIDNLRQDGCLDVFSINDMPAEILAEKIRPAGYYNIKADRLHSFTRFLVSKYNGDVATMAREETGILRKALLDVKGIGPETADSILLYACGKPVFVVDGYTLRALARHDVIDEDSDYRRVQELFMDHLPKDVELYNEYHALWVAVGKDYCKKRQPRCAECPLKGI